MRLLVRILLLALPLAAPCQQVTPSNPISQPSPQASITFTYQNQKLIPSDYQLYIREDGTGRYESSDGGTANGKPFQQDITISPALIHSLFAAARKANFFNLVCEAKGAEHLAFQGNKTVAYEGSDGKGKCTFNYSKIKQIQQLNDDLQYTASTLEVGHRLEGERQHDRLSLDRELEILVSNVADGRALEVQNIRPILEEIAADPNVLNRARQRAAMLAADKAR